MANQAAVRVDVAHDLQTESLRLTAFLAPAAQGDQPTWWADLIGAQPETRTSKPSKGELQETGTVGERTLVLSVLPGRVDWFLGPRLEEGVLRETRWAGRFPDALETFSQLMTRWLAVCPALVRIALGVVAHEPALDKPTAYRKLAQYLPSVTLDPDGSQDLLYQINRPRNSTVIEGLKINRLSRWSAAVFLSLRVEITGQQVQQQQARAGEHSCRVELDINTDPAIAGELPRPRLPEIFEELKDLAVELLTRGDVP
jgi:hypothetical protein